MDYSSQGIDDLIPRNEIAADWVVEGQPGGVGQVARLARLANFLGRQLGANLVMPTWRFFSNLATLKIVQLDIKILVLKVKLAMSVLIDKSVCPHASGQQTAMHVCDERGLGAPGGAGGRAG